MRNLLYLIHTIHAFGLATVCNAISDLYPTPNESVHEYKVRSSKYAD